MADECLDECSLLSTWLVDVSFFDDTGAPVTPNSATYRVDDEKSRQNIVPPTAISPLDETVELEILPNQNRMISTRRDYEVRSVIVEFFYGANRQGKTKYRYKVMNLLKGLSYPVSASMSPSMSASPSV